MFEESLTLYGENDLNLTSLTVLVRIDFILMKLKYQVNIRGIIKSTQIETVAYRI